MLIFNIIFGLNKFERLNLRKKFKLNSIIIEYKISIYTIIYNSFVYYVSVEKIHDLYLRNKHIWVRDHFNTLNFNIFYYIYFFFFKKKILKNLMYKNNSLNFIRYDIIFNDKYYIYKYLKNKSKLFYLFYFVFEDNFILINLLFKLYITFYNSKLRFFFFEKKFKKDKKISNYNLYNIIIKISIEQSLIFKQYWFTNNLKWLILKKIFSNELKVVYSRVSILDLLLKKFFENKLESKISLNFDKYNLLIYSIKNKYVYYFQKRLKRLSGVLRNTAVSPKIFIYISIIFIFTKDLDLFFRLITTVLQSMHFKNHKRFLYYLKLFITKTLIDFYDSSKFLGFYFHISGKLSCAGNSKTRKYIINFKKHSFSNKMLKLKLKKGLVYTKTGVLGFLMMVSYF